MVTLNDINLAINKKLKQAFPNLTINSKDISEGFSRPSLFVDFDDSKKSPFGQDAIERSLHVIIYFFPTSKTNYKQELLEVQEKLENAFTYMLELKDRFIVYLDELSSVKVDGILQFAFDVNYVEVNETDDLENMEQLNINIEGK